MESERFETHGYGGDGRGRRLNRKECAFGSLLLALFDTHSLTILRTLGQILSSSN